MSIATAVRRASGAAPNRRGLQIPLHRMGKVTSDDLFEDREQALFDFYERNAGRYRRALDVGANVGIHAILMARAGWEVRAYEPDPDHAERLRQNIASHGVRVTCIEAALAVGHGSSTFVRVRDNGTANHLAGAREYFGAAEKIRVITHGCGPVFEWADLAKVDVEGCEADLLECVTRAMRCDFLAEIGSAENARRIYGHFRGWRKLWRQSGASWAPVNSAADMPANYKDGTLFIGEAP